MVVSPSAMPNPESLRILSTVGNEDAPETLVLGNEVDERLRELYAAPEPDWVRMNMIGSLNSRVTGPDGTSDTLSNRADRRILRLIREMSDAVVVGAQTVRQEQHTSTGATWLCVVTASGDLSGHRISREDAVASVLVCCPADAVARVNETMPGANTVAIEPVDGRLPLDQVVATLHERGLRQLVVEGGNQLISQFLDEGRIDEVCLTQAPVFAPDSAPSLPGSGHGTSFARVLLAEDSLGYIYQRLFAR